MKLLLEIYWLALTVWMEARGEPFLGQLGVAYVIMNRRGKGSVQDTVLRKLQFSCWNSDSPLREKIDDAEADFSWVSCCKAAAAAYFMLLADPTKGATHYLNPSVLPYLPDWYDKDHVLVTIERHEFLRVA